MAEEETAGLVEGTPPRSGTPLVGTADAETAGLVEGRRPRSGTPPSRTTFEAPSASVGARPSVWRSRGVWKDRDDRPALGEQADADDAARGVRTLWIKGLEFDKNKPAMHKRCAAALEDVVGPHGVEKITVRRKPIKNRNATASWALATFHDTADAQQVLEESKKARLGGGVLTAREAVVDRMSSSDAQAVLLFHTYGDPAMPDLTFEHFRDMMVNVFDAEAEAIRTLWNLPGFNHRQSTLERMEVVSVESFCEHMVKLQLIQGLVSESEPDPFGVKAEDEPELEGLRRSCLSALFCRSRNCCCCGRCCVHEDGNVKIHPEKHFCLKEKQVKGVLSVWDAVLTFLLLWVTATVPVRIGFNLPTELWSAWLFVDLITDFCFIADIFLNFSMAIKKDHFDAPWERNADRVHELYVFGPRHLHGIGPFWVDMMSCVPITYVSLIMGDSPSQTNQKFFRVFRLMRLTKLIRLLKIQSVLQRNTENLRNADWMAVVKSTAGTLVGAHLIACSWHFIIVVGCDVDIAECEHVRESPTWMSVYDADLIDASLWHRYVVSLYFATTTLSTVGFGDIVPTRTSERIFVLCCQLVGVVAFGYTMGTLSAYIAEGDKDPRLLRYNDVMPRVERYLKLRRVSEETREKIKQQLGHVLLKSPEYCVDKEEEVLKDIRDIDAGVERQTVMEVYFTRNKLVPRLFEIHDKGSDLIVELGRMLEPIHNIGGNRYFEPGEIIAHEGEVGQGIFVVETGRCKIDGVQELLGEGDCFGELACMGFGGGKDGRKILETVSAATEMQKLERAFERLDADDSGAISSTELDQGARFLGIVEDSDLCKIMDRIDTDGDGQITRDEFVDFFQAEYPATEKVQLRFLPIKKLHLLFDKFPSMQTTLWMQVSLRRSQHINEQKRRHLAAKSFPQNESQCNAFFDQIYEDQANWGTACTPRRDGGSETHQTLSFKAVLGALDQFSEHLPIKPELPYAEREKMIKEVFDRDHSDNIDKSEFWNGIQHFTNHPTDFRPPIHPTELPLSEQLGALEDRMHDHNAEVSRRLRSLEKSQERILKLLERQTQNPGQSSQDLRLEEG